MDFESLQVFLAFGGIVAAFFTGLLQYIQKRRGRYSKKIETTALPSMEQKADQITERLDKIADQLERTLDRLDRIADFLRDMS